MQNIVFYVSAAETLGVVRDYANAKNIAAPVLVRGVETCLKMRVFANHDGLDPYPTSEFSRVVNWEFVMDKDFDSKTDYILVADEPNIHYATVVDTINEETITYTEFTIPMPNMNTQALVDWLKTDEARSGLNGELIGFDAAGDQVFVLQIKNFTVRGRISNLDGPTEILPEYLTASQVRALVAAGVVFQYSTNRVSWHDTQTEADIYYRQRSATSESAAWSAPVLIAKGAKGEDGAIVSGAGRINFAIYGNEVTMVSEITGETRTAAISGNAIVFPRDFLATRGDCEYDVIDSNGKNITTDPALTRQWTSTGYKLTMLGGFTGTQYALKPCGIRGQEGKSFLDYTAFEVLANNVEIPAGATEYEEIDLSVDGDGLAVAIPACMTHACKFKTLGSSDIWIDWGDGATTFKPVAEIEPDGSYTAEHTYTFPGKYLVKVYGGFARIQTVSGKNLIHRVLEFDLPVAHSHTNLQEFAQNALRLVKVNYNDQAELSKYTNLIRLFSGCSNLRKVTGMSRLNAVASLNGLFQNCFNLKSLDFQMPPVVVLADDGGDGYRNIFQSTVQDAQWSLTCDLNSLFPQGGFSQKIVDISNAFYHAGTRGCYPNITLTAASAEKLAEKLWKDHNKIFRGFTDLFMRMPESVRAHIPIQWGGTKYGLYVDPSTGAMPFWRGVNYKFILSDGISYPSISASVEGDAELAHVSSAFVIRIDATNCKVVINAPSPEEGGTYESYGDVEFRGGTFVPDTYGPSYGNRRNFYYTVIPSGGFTAVSDTVITLDHCFVTAYLDCGGNTLVDIKGGTFVIPENYSVLGTIALSGNAVFDYTRAYMESSYATITYQKGCTINGEVKTQAGTITIPQEA